MNEFNLKKGVNIPLLGKPKEICVEIPEAQRVKIHPYNIKGIKPKLLIKVGDSIKTGSPLFFDKLNPEVMFVSPCSGSIESIRLGPRRIIEEISIENLYNSEVYEKNKTYTDEEILDEKPDIIKEILIKSGCWTYIRQRPFSKIADPKDKPKSIFISGFNTAPHAPNIEFILNQDSKGLQAGINTLSKLTEGNIHLSIVKSTSNVMLSSLKNVKLHVFSGPHPAGNVGIQIHHIDPINIGEKVWYIDIQDVLAIGQQLLNGHFSTMKYITISGEGVNDPCYMKVRRNTEIKSILKNRIKTGSYRIISGDVLTGNKINIEFGLGYYHSQISVLPESNKREFLGWLKPGKNKYTLSNTYISKFLPKKEWSLNTLVNGSSRTIIPFGYWENVLPMDILPQYLVKSILANDIEEMEQLGIYECDAEDFALCSFVCQSKVNVSQIINNGLEYIEKEG